MTQVIRRSNILNTEVITRNNGKQLGTVTQVWVDVNQREVVALGLLPSRISLRDVPRLIYFHRISQIGETILVDNEDAIDDIEVEVYSNIMNWEVITETGKFIGRVRGFKFNAEDGKICSMAISSVGILQILDQFLSTYEISVDEIVSTNLNRMIVFAGAEKRVTRLSAGILERLGIGTPRERSEDKEYGTYASHIMGSQHPENSDEDDCGGSSPIPIPRRPSPKPSDDELSELLPIEHKPPYREARKVISVLDNCLIDITEFDQEEDSSQD